MLSRATQLRLVILAIGFSGGTSRLPAQATAKSPFMPATAAAAAAAPTAGAPIEFRAYMDIGDGMQYRLFDPAKKAGVWVRLNEKNTEFDVTAKQHDEAQKTLTVEHQGRTLTLALREAKVVSAGSAGQMLPPPPVAPPPGAPNVAPAVTQSVVLNPTPADEQRRLEAVAAEVARRRALREQATQQIGQGMTPQNFPPPGSPGMNPGAPRPPGSPVNQAR